MAEYSESLRSFGTALENAKDCRGGLIASAVAGMLAAHFPDAIAFLTEGTEDDSTGDHDGDSGGTASTYRGTGWFHWLGAEGHCAGANYADSRIPHFEWGNHDAFSHRAALGLNPFGHGLAPRAVDEARSRSAEEGRRPAGCDCRDFQSLDDVGGFRRSLHNTDCGMFRRS